MPPGILRDPAAHDRGPVTGEHGSEVGAISRASAELLDVVADTVEHTHTAISERVFTVLGPVGAGVRPIHDGLTRLTYRMVRGGLRGAGAATGALADRHPRLRRLQPLQTRRGLRVLAAASGIVGDRLAEQDPRLDLGLDLYHEDGPLRLDADLITATFPRCRGELVVFVHGLCEDERSWHRPARAHRAADRDGEAEGAEVVTHGRRLARTHGMTPLYVRYNTGRRIQDNGARLARLLEETVTTWPVEVTRIALVGHSMGGLVLRSASHHAVTRGLGWTERVSDVVYLGTPHLGAPLARGVHAAARALARLPEGRGITGLLDHRSDGVRDLTTGRVLPEVSEVTAALRETAGDPPPLPDARHHLLASTITRDPAHPVGRVVGDLMVRSDSGSGRSRRRDAGLGDDVVVLGGMDHFDLLSDPDVGAQLEAWLAPDPT